MGLLGELQLEKGNVKVTGKLAYAAQQPWIFSASLRQNIIFGQNFDKKKYDKCIKAAALIKVIQQENVIFSQIKAFISIVSSSVQFVVFASYTNKACVATSCCLCLILRNTFNGVRSKPCRILQEYIQHLLECQIGLFCGVLCQD